jgi:two-component system chemotaxis response regulator CheB
MIKILVVDDSALMRRLIGAALKVEGDLAVEFARDGVEALERLKDFKPDVITLDVHMPQMDGLACLDRIMIERPTPVVMVSSLTEAGAGATLEAISLGAVDFVAKPAGAISLVMDEFAPVLIGRPRRRASIRLCA